MDTVGIIDDDEDCGLLYSHMLSHKWHVVFFQDWEKALIEFEINPPHVILLDISIPGTNGEAVLGLIRKIPSLKHVGVIAVTGHTLPGDRHKFLNQGFNEYIAKPIVDYTKLDHLIEKVLITHTKKV